MSYINKTLILSLVLSYWNKGLAEELAFPGFSGVLSTPNANITGEGKLNYQWNTYGEPAQKSRYDKTYNHTFTIGVTSNLEIGARLTDYFNEDDKINPNTGIKPGFRDLSGNIKFLLPKVSEKLPDLAIGANDVAGQAQRVGSSQYIVASKKIGNSELSIGYAKGENEAFRGGFGSIAYEVNPNLKIFAEHDTLKYSVGGSYNLEEKIGLPIALKAAMPVSGTGKKEATFAITASIPLDNRPARKNKAEKRFYDFEDNIVNYPVKNISPDSFIRKLTKYNFENMLLGKKSDSYVLTFENRVYNHNFMDGLGIALGTAHEFLGNEGGILIILTDNKVPKIALSTSLGNLKGFLESKKGKKVSREFSSQLKVWYPKPDILEDKDIQWLDGTYFKNKTYVDVTLQPDINTSFGSEWGVFDYSLAARVDANMPVWGGGTINTTVDIPLDKSATFNDGSVFDKDAHELGIKQASIQQVLKPSAQSTALLSAGMTNVRKEDYYTVQSEAAWLSKSGNTKLYGKAAYFKPTDENQKNHDLMLAGIRQEWPNSNWYAEANYGKFFQGDKGANLSIGRRFGDTELTAYTKYIAHDEVAAGLQISFPLTPREDYKHQGLVLRGNERWQHTQQTVVNDPVFTNINPVRTDMLLEPELSHNLTRDYLKSGTLSPAYVKANIERLREAYFNLRKD